jgi:hypothetical protein
MRRRGRFLLKLDDVFEALTAALYHGAQVLKFLGDGMLASFAPRGRDVQ